MNKNPGAMISTRFLLWISMFYVHYFPDAKNSIRVFPLTKNYCLYIGDQEWSPIQ
jgi:hypothetical protein